MLILAVVGSPAPRNLVPVAVPEPVNVQGIAPARDCVRLTGGQPYTVPAGHWLVLTALGSSEPNLLSFVRVSVFVNGEEKERLTFLPPSEYPFSTMTNAPSGMTYPPGTILELGSTTASSSNLTRAWGYLVGA